MFSNRQILSAVISRWLQPAINDMASAKLVQLPFFANIDAKVRASGWVSPMWSIGQEIAPLLSGISSQLIEPMIAKYLANVPDGAIPELAHTMVKNAIDNNGLSLFEGNIVFEKSDLEDLQRLLKYNLPIKQADKYEVITNENEQQ